MSLVLDLPPIIEKRLADEAARAGLSQSQYAVELLAGKLASSAPTHFYFAASHQEFNDALNALAAQTAALPPLPDVAFDCETLYEER
jgi:hypothetical protein